MARDRPIQLAAARITFSNKKPRASPRSPVQPLPVWRESMSQPEPNVDEVVRSIAEETDTPPETVSRMYADTLADYRHDARVFDYVPLFAAKKVRNKLRDASHRKH
jgi:hypothetical protein